MSCVPLSWTTTHIHNTAQFSLLWAHLLVAFVGALPCSDCMQGSTCSCLVPLCISPHQLSQLSDLSLLGPSISFAQDLSWAVSWTTTQKDTALRPYSPASRQHVQATPLISFVSIVDFTMSPHCSLTAVDMMCFSQCFWLVIPNTACTHTCDGSCWTFSGLSWVVPSTHCYISTLWVCKHCIYASWWLLSGVCPWRQLFSMPQRLLMHSLFSCSPLCAIGHPVQPQNPNRETRWPTLQHPHPPEVVETYLLCHSMPDYHELGLNRLTVSPITFVTSFGHLPRRGHQHHIIRKLSFEGCHLAGVSCGPSEQLLVKLVVLLYALYCLCPLLNHHTGIQVKQSRGHCTSLIQAIIPVNLLQMLSIHSYPGLHDQILSTTRSGTPSFFSAVHIATCGTESYALLRSTKMKCCFMWCSKAFWVNCLTTISMSVQPCPRLKPYSVSGNTCSASVCCMVWTILAATFPTTSSSAMPLQLLQQCKFPFLGIGRRMASTHSCGMRLSSHTALSRSVSMHTKSTFLAPTFSISGRMLEVPAAFPFHSFLSAFATSADVGSSARFSLTCLCVTDANTSASYFLVMLKNLGEAPAPSLMLSVFTAARGTVFIMNDCRSGRE